LVVVLWAGMALGQVTIEATLGWGGIPVLDRVNPLWIEVANLGEELVAGELAVVGEVGTPWRGEARRSFSAPLAIPPRGQARFLLPWELARGTRELSITVLSPAGTALASLRLPIQAALTPLEGSVGPGPGIPLHPEELTDPILLHPFSRIRVAEGSGLGEEEWGVLASWAAWLGGELEAGGRRGRWGRPWPPREALEAALLGSRLPRPPLGPLVGALGAYLLGAGFALGGLARGRWALAGLFFGLSLALALFCPVLYKPATGAISFGISIVEESVPSMCLELLAITAARPQPWQGEGWWWELLPAAPGGWEGRDLCWSLGPHGPQTSLQLRPGQVRVLWRLTTPAAPPQGEHRFRLAAARGWVVRLDDDREGLATHLLPPPLLPFWEYLQASLLPGDSFSFAISHTQRGPDLSWQASLSLPPP